MFSRLLSAAQVSPSETGKLFAYRHTLLHEIRLRKIGVALLIASLSVQLIAALFPPEKGLQFADDHIINGINTKHDIVSEWDNASSKVSDIYSKFGVTRQDISNLSEYPEDKLVINQDSNYWGTSRNYPSLGKSTPPKSAQVMALLTQDTNFYFYPMRESNAVAANKPLNAFKGRNSTTGQPFWILADTGTYIQNGKMIGKQKPAKVSVKVSKTILENPSQTSENTYKIALSYRNTTPDSLAEDVVIVDQLNSSDFDIINVPQGAELSDSGTIRYSIGNLPYSSQGSVTITELKTKTPSFSLESLCYDPEVESANAVSNASSAGPAVICESINDSDNSTNNGVNTSTYITETDTKTSVITDKESIQTGTIALSHEVRNITQNKTNYDASSTTNKPGDVLEFRLIIINSGTQNIQNYRIQNVVSDIIDYADLSLDQLAENGGKFDKTKSEIYWENQTLPAHSETLKTFRATIKDPLPATNQPSALTTHYDCKIDNTFGNTTRVELTCPPSKAIELMPTGIKQAMLLGISSAAVAVFFLARAKVLHSELQVFKRRYHGLAKKGDGK